MSNLVNILNILSKHAISQPNKRAWTFINDDGKVVDSFTYLELELITDMLSNHLKVNCNIKAGDRAVLVFFPGLLFSVALLACFKAGIIAVPVFPPDPRRLKKDLEHFISIQSSCGAKIALTHAPYDFAKKMAALKAIFSSGGTVWPEMTWIPIDDIVSREKARLAKLGSNIPPRTIVSAPSSIAFLQYTSGSTSEPKGVMISHDNLAHNLVIITRELAVDTSTINVSWLPQYHDMGLIGSYLGCLYCGGTGIYMSPISFLKDPNMWLETISKFRGSHTQAPNFAYALACRKFKETGRLKKGSSGGAATPSTSPAEGLDLSCLKHMINAAEPVDADAIADFYATFKPFGLPDHVVVPTYGLAEHTVFVCSAGKTLLHVNKAALETGTAEVVDEAILGQNVPVSARAGLQSIVGCGIPEKAEGVDLMIVDPETRFRVDDNKVGEIWVNSPSKALGYWDKPDISDEVFNATLASAGEPLPATSVNNLTYLRTGDLGFMRNGELFICGRLKDLIIVRGANHYPQDLERTAEKCGAEHLRAGCSAAFAVPMATGGTEGVVYLAEVKPGTPAAVFPSLVDSLRLIIVKEHGLGLTSICLLEPRTIEKTTSGKIARAWCRRAYLKGTLKLLYRWDGIPEEIYPELVGESTKVSLKQEDVASASAAVPGERDNLLEGSAGHAPRKAPIGLDSAIPVEELRGLSDEELAMRLERAVLVVSAQGPSPLSGPIDRARSLMSLGLDSMTIIQFKGLLERRFYCSVPDEFMFTELCTIAEMVMVVRLGELTSDQKAAFENTVPVTNAENNPQGKSTSDTARRNNNGRSTTIEIHARREPWCPWFTCCY